MNINSRWLLKLAFILLPALALAQNQRTTGTIMVWAAPSGTCLANSPMEYYSSGNQYWGCVLPTIASLTGTWTQVGSGGGGGTVTSVGFSTNLGTAGGTPVTTSGTLTQTVTAANVVSLFSTCSGVLYLGADGACHAPGSGTVTTVGFTGGLISVANPTTTPAFTVAGTSGGIPYFSSASTWASSGALGANLPVFGGGAGASPIAGTRSGNTTQVVTTTGAQTSGDCVKIDASGNHIANGAACIVVIASGAKTLNTTAVSANTCGSAQTDTATGTLTTDSFTWVTNGDITAVTGYNVAGTFGLEIFAYPTADTVNFKVCNTTGSSITPGAVTLNWKVTR